MTADVIPQLVEEFRKLGQPRPGDNAQPVVSFSAKPWEAYTLTAALQAASRHPGLSDTQREVVLGYAHQIADQLTAMARAILGPESAIETTAAMGFLQQFDVPLDPDEDDDLPIEVDDDEEDDDLAAGVVGDDDAHILGERRCRYVEPKWIVQTGDPEDAELNQCARCSRFFVQDVPIRMFLGEGSDMLGLALCETCAPTVMRAMQEH
jgi:hypothetical protein